MKNKPLIFTILTILCVIEPVMKVLYFKAVTHFDFSVILSNLLMRNSLREILDFWLVFPIAGLLILKLRTWTYFGFMGILSYVVYSILNYESYSWPYNSATPFLYHYVIVSIAAGVFLLFLSPKIREPFFDRRARLWESIERYPVRIQGALKEGSQFHQAEILNVSKTGAFVKGLHFDPEKELTLNFIYAGKTIDLPVIVKHSHPFNGQEGTGLMFKFTTWKQRFKIARVVFELKHKRHPATVVVKPV